MNKKNPLNKALKKEILKAQRNEITEYHIYTKLSKTVRKNRENREILAQIGKDEKRHYDFWKEYTDTEVSPNRLKVLFFVLVSRLLGLTFGIKLMEKGEEQAQINYDEIARNIPEADKISKEEEAHEKALIDMLNEERLNYVGSIVLGLNDALVELTGALAGLTLAFRDTRMIALAGLITGIAASFSMAASEYLSTRSEGGENAGKSAIYTGMAYIVTVFLLILPYLLLSNYIVCLAVTLSVAVLIIFIFNFYISIAKDYNFGKRFLEMAGISLGVSALSFGIGFAIRHFLKIEV